MANNTPKELFIRVIIQTAVWKDMKEDRHWKFHWTELYKTGYFWATSDFVKNPIPESVWENVREMFLHGKARDMILDPFGRKMGEISEYELPFLQRKGNLYNIQYLDTLQDDEP
ncbi:tetrahydrocannabinolic acid synthase-like [Olea europaea subsp. europaea]|uniref:Tetrahydrocannabinolic acid synthase-like n=1 Tax=Olea europaea subsp. europaea TaxID=158383 RepID=A0A8S0VNV3_OLEEU|nr:tetrahydrocannabinolic acid synthase-like [Olea europaea subsp. europaea]